MRLIDAEALKNEVKGLFCTDGYIVDFIKIIDNAPTVEQKYYERIIAQINPVIEVRPKGEWIVNNDFNPECPYCHHSFSYWSNFCPECGADMRGEK